jgi:hypothetical protein
MLSTGCGRSTATQAEIERRAQEIADKRAKDDAMQKRETDDERVAAEAEKIAEQQANFSQMQQEQRDKAAADIQLRTEQVQQKRMALMELAAAEQARREALANDVKTFVDDLDLSLSVVNDKATFRVNGGVTATNNLLISPAGFGVVYRGMDGDLYLFEYSDDAFSVNMKRPLRGVCLATVQHKKPLAEGISADMLAAHVASSAVSSPSAVASPKSDGRPDFNSFFSALQSHSYTPELQPSPPESHSSPSSILMILKATYGAGNVQRDVKAFVKAKIANDRLQCNAGSGDLGGDPAWGKSKTFYIKYMYHGRIFEKTYQEGAQVSLP